MCTKRYVNICAKFWENIEDCFWFMDIVSIDTTQAKVYIRNPGLIGLTAKRHELFPQKDSTREVL